MQRLSNPRRQSHDDDPPCRNARPRSTDRLADVLCRAEKFEHALLVGLRARWYPLARSRRFEQPKDMSDEDLKAELEKLRAENERLKSQRGRSVSLKVSEKGGVSVYGLGRFPVTLYKEQWAKLLAMADEIRAFIKDNEPKLKAKPE